MGHRVTANGLQVDPGKIEAITTMAPPTDLGELLRFRGMVNYVGKFMPNLSTVMQPLHNLSKKDVPWNWSESEDGAFEKVKVMICQTPVLAFYDPNKELTVENDACEYGIGSVLRQEDRPVAYASRSLSEAERRYAQIEKEMLAAVYGLEKFHHYTYGREVQVVTDHKPLVAISNKPLSKAPKRLQSLLLRAKNYNTSITYKPGTDIPVADALSRAPMSKPASEEVINSIGMHRLRDKRLDEIRRATTEDSTLTSLGKVITEGWPDDRHGLPGDILPYFNYRDEMTVQDGIIYRADRVVIPKSLRAEMKEKVHAGHLGINSCLRRARDLIFWPGMSDQIRQYVENCGTCAEDAAKQPKETPIVTEIPARPWQKIASDLFSFGGYEYMVTVDYHSNFFEVDRLRDQTSETVIRHLKAHLARHGIADKLVTDNGTQYMSASFRSFRKEWGFEHETISPGNSQANGAAEAAVKIAKRMMRRAKKKGQDPYLGLLNLRNTPTEGLNTSPAHRLFGRRTQSSLPMTEAKLLPKYTNSAGEATIKERRRAEAAEHPQQQRNDLKPLHIGDTVRMQLIASSKKESGRRQRSPNR
jgi:hypothetical protein